MLTIAREIVEEIVAHARSEHPRECCGILAGKNNFINHIFKLTNIETDPEKYWMDPREQIQTFEGIDRLHLELLGIYHSHPHSLPYPSPLDIKRAFYPTIAFFIISLHNPEKPELRAFQIVKGKVRGKRFRVEE
jgi:proteasome lid subunit RPN8/RPN11